MFCCLFYEIPLSINTLGVEVITAPICNLRFPSLFYLVIMIQIGTLGKIYRTAAIFRPPQYLHGTVDPRGFQWMQLLKSWPSQSRN
jgi:hypothetical protein